MSRGHRERDIIDGYPVGYVMNLAKAAKMNRRQAALDLAIGVSLGIRDAFSEKGLLVQAWFKDGQDGREKSLASRPDPAQPFFGGLPVVTKKRRPHA